MLGVLLITAFLFLATVPVIYMHYSDRRAELPSGPKRKALTDFNGDRYEYDNEPPKPVSTSDPGFWLLPSAERHEIEQKEWNESWNAEYKALNKEHHRLFYGLTEEEEADYLKIAQEIEYALVRVKHVKDVRHRDYGLDPDVNTMFNLGGERKRVVLEWHQSVREDVRFKDLNNPDEVPTGYRKCGCTQCYKRLIDYLRDYEQTYVAKLTDKGRERYSAKNRKALPGYSAIKYMDPKDKGVQFGKETRKAIERARTIAPRPRSGWDLGDGTLIVDGAITADTITTITADKITSGSISAHMIRATPIEDFKKNVEKGIKKEIPTRMPNVRAVATAMLERRTPMRHESLRSPFDTSWDIYGLDKELS